MNQTLITQGLTVDELLTHMRGIVRDELAALPKPEKIKPYISRSEAADLIGVTDSKIYQLTSEKKIPHIKKGGKLLFNRQELIAWLEDARQPVTE